MGCVKVPVLLVDPEKDRGIVMKLKDGVPCGHIGCLNHVTHPCEGCGRTGGIKQKVSCVRIPIIPVDPRKDEEIEEYFSKLKRGENSYGRQTRSYKI